MVKSKRSAPDCTKNPSFLDLQLAAELSNWIRCKHMMRTSELQKIRDPLRVTRFMAQTRAYLKNKLKLKKENL